MSRLFRIVSLSAVALLAISWGQPRPEIWTLNVELGESGIFKSTLEFSSGNYAREVLPPDIFTMTLHELKLVKAFKPSQEYLMICPLLHPPTLEKLGPGEKVTGWVGLSDLLSDTMPEGIYTARVDYDDRHVKYGSMKYESVVGRLEGPRIRITKKNSHDISADVLN